MSDEKLSNLSQKSNETALNNNNNNNNNQNISKNREIQLTGSTNQERLKKRRSQPVHNSEMQSHRLKTTDNSGYNNRGFGIQHSMSTSHISGGNGAFIANSVNKRIHVDSPQNIRPSNHFMGKPKHIVNHRTSFVVSNNVYPSEFANPVPQISSESPNRTPAGKVKFHANVNNNNNNNKTYSKTKQSNQGNKNFQNLQYNVISLQRSKSLSSADGMIYNFAGLDIGGDNFDENDIGQLSPEIKALIKSATANPNNVNSRYLMELPSHFVKRAVEGRRYALPIARICFNIIAKEQKETFLESLLNTCRQWYQEREKLMFQIQGMKSPSRLRLISFMEFLTEMFCKLKRRQMQLGKHYEGLSPPLVLLSLVAKCCEEIVKPPIKSLTEIECLFYVLTYTGSDLEIHLSQELENILSRIRDGFLNANDSPPAIRRTLLQLIELQASHWQLPGNTVLYYYPSGK